MVQAHCGSQVVVTMALSRVDVATRAFVAVLLFLARRYALVLPVNRESSEDCLGKAYRRLLLKAHPDKGGRKEDLQKLQAAREERQKVRKDATPKAGRPFFDAEPSTAEDGTLACARQRKRKDYRVSSVSSFRSVHSVSSVHSVRAAAAGRFPETKSQGDEVCGDTTTEFR